MYVWMSTDIGSIDTNWMVACLSVPINIMQWIGKDFSLIVIAYMYIFHGKTLAANQRIDFHPTNLYDCYPLS